MKAVIAAVLVAAALVGCAQEKEPLCLRQTCEERYRWVFVPVGKGIMVRQKQVQTVCQCHEVYVPGEAKPFEGE